MSLSRENIAKLKEARRTALIQEAQLYVRNNLESILLNDTLYPRTATIIRDQFIKSDKKTSDEFYEKVAKEIVAAGAYDGEEFE